MYHNTILYRIMTTQYLDTRCSVSDVSHITTPIAPIFRLIFIIPVLLYNRQAKQFVIFKHTYLLILGYSARNNSRPLSIFRPISVFGRPKSILISHIFHTFLMGNSSVIDPIFKKAANQFLILIFLPLGYTQNMLTVQLEYFDHSADQNGLLYGSVGYPGQ